MDTQGYAEVRRVLAEVLELWETMKHSDIEDAGDDAERFQMTFYVFMDTIRKWIAVMEQRPKDATAAQSDERIAKIFHALPSELQIPFELELDSAFSEVRSVDSTEQG